VAFNSNGALAAAQRAPHDLTVRLEVNHWNGGVEPRAVLAGAHPRGSGPAGETHGCAACEDMGWWWERFERELARELGAPGDSSSAVAAHGPQAGERRVLDARRGSVVARIAELLSSGGRVLVLSADAARRAALAARVDLSGGAATATVCLRCPPGELVAPASGESALLLTDWDSLAAAPEAARGFEHLVAVDPPSSPVLDALARPGPGYLHEGWGPVEDLAEPCWDAEWELRSALAEIYRALVPAGGADGEAMRAIVGGAGRFVRSPEASARCVRVLSEIGILQCGGTGGARWIGVVSSERTELERSGAWRAFASTHQEGRRYLQSRRVQR